MKYSVAFLAAALAGIASADHLNSTSTAAQAMVTSIVYTTQVVTVTSCPASVSSCPAHSTIVKTMTVAAYTTICPATQTPSSAPAAAVTSTKAATPA